MGIPRIFGTAVVGGIVVDSFTPSLEKRGGKGVLGGGKNSGEVKYGTFQVLIGEGERFWNDKINDDVPTGLTTYFLQDPSDDSGTISERTDYRTTASGTGHDRYADYTYNQFFNSVSNEYTFILRTLKAVPSNLTRGHCYYFIGDNWVIPSSDLPSLQSVSISFSPPGTANTLTDVGIAFEQGGNLYFRGINASGPYWYNSTSGGGVNALTIARSAMSAKFWPAGNPTWDVGTSGPLNLGEGAPPIRVYILLHATNGGVGIPAGQTNTLTLSNTSLSYVANNRNDRGLLALEKIWMNDEIWYNTETTNSAQIKKNDEHERYFSFYNGALSQGQDPSLVALRGAANVPGLQGYSHIVFHNLPLNVWSNNYPTVKVQVTSTLPATPESIIRDCMFRAGARYNKPLIEGKDWAWTINDDGSPAIDTDTYKGVTIDGYVIKYDSIDLKTILSDISQIFRVAIACNPATNFQLDDYAGFFPEVSPVYKVVPSSYNKTIDVEAEVIGTSEATNEGLPWPTKIEGKSADEIPGQVEVQFYNINKGGERESVLVDRATFQNASNYTFNPNYYTNRRISTANSIAKFIIYQGLARAKQITTASFPNQNLGLLNVADWQGTLALRPQKLILGADGTYEVTGVVINDDVLDEEFVADTIVDLQDPSDIAVDVDALWTEGQSILAPTTGSLRTIYAWLAPPTDGSIANPASVLISYDGGSFETTPINSAGANAQQITINSIPSENLNDFRYSNIDTSSVISVTVPNGIELLSTELEFILEGTKNILYIESYGFVGFQTATLTGANTYDLTNLYWNVGQGLIDEGWRTAQTATVAWLLLGQPYEISIPATVPKGTDISVIAATSGNNSATFTRPYKALNSSPRHVTNFSVDYAQGSEDITISWAPYIDQSTQIIPNLFEDPPIINDTYTVIIREGATVRRTETALAARSFNYTEALQATDGVLNRANLSYEVIQEGLINTMDSSVEYDAEGRIKSV